MLSNLNENYYLRNCFLKNNEVPTQSMIRQKMCKSLAHVYFNSMSHKHKILAGLEPMLEGGGKDRLVYPSDILSSRPKLRPMKKELLEKLRHSGIELLGQKLEADHRKALDLKKKKKLQDNDNYWKKILKEEESEEWKESLFIESIKTNEKLNIAFKQFESLYMTSLTELEHILQSSSVQKILILKNNLNQLMQQRFYIQQQQQLNMLNARFCNKITEKKNKMKSKFLDCILNERKTAFNEIEYIQIEKQKAQEMLRQQMECQNLARQMYIASVERYHSKKRSQEIRIQHESEFNKLKISNEMKDFEIELLKKKVKDTEELNKLWQNKVGHILDYFKEFVCYCLKNVPEQEHFFNNIYKMLSENLCESFNDHNKDDFLCDGTDKQEKEEISDNITRDSEKTLSVKPFVLYGDFKQKVFDAKLCGKSLNKDYLPVILVNKRCIYAACDNFEIFSEKIKEFVEPTRDTNCFLCEEESRINTNIKQSDYKGNVDIRLESSLMKVIHSEISNISEESPTKPCFCYELDSNFSVSSSPAKNPSIDMRSLAFEKSKNNMLLSSKSSIKHCTCAFRAKKKLEDHLPPYMFGQKVYSTEILPHYEACTRSVLKMLTTKKLPRKLSTLTHAADRFKDVETQCTDAEYESICMCLSDVTSANLNFDAIRPSKLFDDSVKKQRFQLVGASMSNQLNEESRTFATKRADSLRNLLIAHPSVSQLFTDENKSW